MCVCVVCGVVCVFVYVRYICVCEVWYMCVVYVFTCVWCVCLYMWCACVCIHIQSIKITLASETERLSHQWSTQQW